MLSQKHFHWKPRISIWEGCQAACCPSNLLVPCHSTCVSLGRRGDGVYKLAQEGNKKGSKYIFLHLPLLSDQSPQRGGVVHHETLETDCISLHTLNSSCCCSMLAAQPTKNHKGLDKMHAVRGNLLVQVRAASHLLSMVQGSEWSHGRKLALVYCQHITEVRGKEFCVLGRAKF